MSKLYLVKNTYPVTEIKTAIRFNTFCELMVKEIPSRKGIKKAIKKGAILLNNQIVEGGRWLNVGDVITLVDLNPKPPKEFQLNYPVVFEDDYLAVINKPAGYPVSGNQYKTIQNTLSFNLQKSTLEDALNWPLPVHRLDAQTSGLLIIAKTRLARIKLGQFLEQKKIQKTYHALVTGSVRLEGEICIELEAKEAITQIKVLKAILSLQNKHLTLLELSPKTGRTHQLRKHCKAIGHPIVGDKIYGEKGRTLKHKGLFLCAVSLAFIHPVTKEALTISIPTPSKFLKRMENEERRYRNYYP